MLQLLGVVLDDPGALGGVVHRLETGFGDRLDKLALGVGDAPGEDELGLSVDGGDRGSEAGDPHLLHRCLVYGLVLRGAGSWGDRGFGLLRWSFDNFFPMGRPRPKHPGYNLVNWNLM